MSFGLGTILHEITYPGVAKDSPSVIDQWEAVEAAPGGYQSAAGRIEAARVIDHPDVYRQGAQWCSYLKETGVCVFKGTLLPPVIYAGVATIAARGLAFKASRAANRLLWQSRYYGDWMTADSDPYNLQNGAWDYDSTGGKLSITIPPGTNVSVGENGGFVFSAPSGDSGADPNVLTRIAFTMRGTGAFEWRFYVYRFPNTLVGLDGAGVACVDGNTVDRTLSVAGDMIWLRIHATANHPIGSAAEMYAATNLQLNGIAPGNAYSASQVVSDIAARLGFDTSLAQGTSDSVLPIDQKQGTYGDILDYVSLLTDTRWLFTSYNGITDVCDFGPWTTRSWFMVDPELPFNPVPAELFDEVRVPYAYSAGSTSGIMTVNLTPSPLPDRNCFADISMQTPLPDSTVAESLGLSILGWLSTVRYGGDAELAEVRDSDGTRRSAHLVRAGDTMFTSTGVPMRIASLTRKADRVSVTFDSKIAALDRMLARRSQMLELKGLMA